jgi:hypothetical protein
MAACPKCGSEMTGGHVTAMVGSGPTYTQGHEWVSGPPVPVGVGGNKGAAPQGQERFPLRAYRCPRCGCVEFYAQN